jgi:hypothetical protein
VLLQDIGKTNDLLEEERRITGQTTEEYRKSLEYEQEHIKVVQQLNQEYGKLGTKILPIETGFLSGISDLLSNVNKNGFLAGIGKSVDDLGAADPFGLGGEKSSATPSAAGGNDVVAFWRSQGYSDQQIAGILGNVQQESGGNPAARNAGHYGLFQFSEQRRQEILAGTGIDVATASDIDQHRAAAWDMHRRGDDARIKSANSVQSAALIDNSYFEVSGDTGSSLANRVKYANEAYAGIAARPLPPSGGGGSSPTINIGDVTINTQATDSGAIAREFRSAVRAELGLHYHEANSANDDGIGM